MTKFGRFPLVSHKVFKRLRFSKSFELHPLHLICPLLYHVYPCFGLHHVAPWTTFPRILARMDCDAFFMDPTRTIDSVIAMYSFLTLGWQAKHFYSGGFVVRGCILRISVFCARMSTSIEAETACRIFAYQPPMDQSFSSLSNLETIEQPP